MTHLYFKRISIVALFFGILLLAFWLRIQIVHGIPDEQFISADAFLYYTQAQTISEQERLPAAVRL